MSRDGSEVAGFVDPQARLAGALSANQPGSSTAHVVVMVPSYSVADSLMAHYLHRIPALEHRYLLSLLVLPRVPGCEIVFVTSLRPADVVVDYYLSLMPRACRADVASRIHLVDVPDPTPRTLSAKLLDRPDLIAGIRRTVGGRAGYLDPWNVTAAEMELAHRLDLPLNGTRPELWPLGFKSAGRKVMRAAGVPLPLGHEDVSTVEGVVAAAESVRREHPASAGVVVKTDNSGTGDGNRVLRFANLATADDVRAAVEALEPWYLADLTAGVVVEELVEGPGFASPSVQVDITPGGRVAVLSTHEQLLGGHDGQVYVGCRFPADASYGDALSSHGEAVGRVLAEHGAMGRFCVDFAAVRTPSGGAALFGLEINLRKGGTTHPYSVLRNLAPGRYDVGTGRWITDDGDERCYRSTDNLVDPAWRGRAAHDVIEAIRAAGLEFDPRSRTGVVLHMFCGLDIDGRIGLTAIGVSDDHAEELYAAAVTALSVPAVPAGVPVPV